MSHLKRTPLYERHLELGGKMAPFAGYEMPISYGGTKAEHEAVRHGCGIFDISHMAPIRIFAAPDGGESGHCLAFLEGLTCRLVKNMEPGQVQYNALTLENGGLLDDITIYRSASGEYMIVANGANEEAVLSHLWQRAKLFNDENNSNIEIENIKESAPGTCFLAVQGPSSPAMLGRALAAALGVEVGDVEFHIDSLKYYHFLPLSQLSPAFEGSSGFLSRTGYSGEDGFEILSPLPLAQALWSALVSLDGVFPSGLAARDILRMEAFYPLYGHELSSEVTPGESGLGWIVSQKKDYLGKDAIIRKKLNPEKNICGFIMKEKGPLPRAGFVVKNKGGATIGHVTSGGFSFTWERGFGLCQIEAAERSDGNEVSIEIRGADLAAVVHLKSPHEGSIRRQKG